MQQHHKSKCSIVAHCRVLTDHKVHVSLQLLERTWRPQCRGVPPATQSATCRTMVPPAAVAVHRQAACTMACTIDDATRCKAPLQSACASVTHDDFGLHALCHREQSACHGLESAARNHFQCSRSGPQEWWCNSSIRGHNIASCTTKACQQRGGNWAAGYQGRTDNSGGLSSTRSPLSACCACRAALG